ncbi:MAG: helix-turn-helix domain-containing protein [Streptosporangiaceae bacterium]
MSARSCEQAAPVRFGPQAMVRSQTLSPAIGRPPDFEQAEIAAMLGARLRELRAEYGLGLRQLERRSGVNRATISRLEHGLRRPRASVLGWIAWGFDPDQVDVIKAGLSAAAGASLIIESRWSERAHARRAYRALLSGDLALPPWLVADQAVAVFGPITREEETRAALRTLQERARSGGVPWPEGAAHSGEALHLGNELAGASWRELALIGQGQMRARSRAFTLEANRRRHDLRVSLGLAGPLAQSVRSSRILRQIPPEERPLIEAALMARRAAYTEQDGGTR